MTRVIRSFYKASFEEIGAELLLDREESFHLSKVLRRVKGDRIEVLDGRGIRAKAECLEVTSQSVRVSILEIQKLPQVIPQIRMLISLTKSGGWEDLVKPLTELGVNQVTPLITERTEVKMDKKKFENKKNKCEKLAMEGCKQSGNPWLPGIDDPQTLASYLSECDRPIFMASLAAGVSGLSIDQNIQAFDILVGPEGGWTVNEERMSKANGARFFSLGSSTLRTETAVLSSLAVARNQFLD